MRPVDVSGEGEFTKDKLTQALRAVCAAANLDPTGARLLRLLNNAVFSLERHPVVVRIVASDALYHRVDPMVRAATWLAEHELPVVRLVPGIDQPVRVDGYVATLWRTVPHGGPAPTGRDLAKVLRRVHALRLPPFELPRWRPLDDVRTRIAEAEAIEDDDREFLMDRCAELDERVAALEFDLPIGLVHGDAHLGNLISSPGGPVLCDFDSTCVGPPEWDLVPLAVGVIRFGEPVSRYREFASAYGVDIATWRGFPLLRELRELKIVTSVLPVMRSNPEIRPEMHRRFTDFRHGNTDGRWGRYT